MNAAAGASRYLVTAPPPTPNGDLHVGHISGPYLAADVFCRAQRLLGATALYVSGADQHQSCMVTTAEQLGTDPEGLAEECRAKIQESLAMAGVAVDAFGSPDPEYVASVQSFFESLYDAGRLRRRTYAFSYCKRSRRFLIEAFASGYCPACYAPTSGAICEDCGHPNDADSLMLTSSSGTGAGDGAEAELERREVEVLVLALEDHREQIEAFYERRRTTMRPHVLRFVEEMLAEELPDWPVTYPLSWGIPVSFGDLDGQVINPWAEILPGAMHIAASAQRRRVPAPNGHIWSEDSGYRLVQFLGYDNTFYYSLAHLALAFAHGGLLEPTAILTNEFYDLDGHKFSTSRRHLIWARDLIGHYGADNVRFYLALDNPEQQAANFIETEFVEAVRSRLHEPLQLLARTLDEHAGRRVSLDSREASLFTAFRSRMLRAYALETFSMRTAAETLANLLALLVELTAGERTGDRELALVVLGLRYGAAYASPLMPSLAEALSEELGGDASGQAGPPVALADEPPEALVETWTLPIPSLDVERLLRCI